MTIIINFCFTLIKQGKQYTISGWTDEENVSSNLPLGNIRILAGIPYDSNNPDSSSRHPIQKQYRELITEAPDLSQKWAEMVCNAKSKDIYPYDFLKQNSNTLADTVLREAGLKEPKKDGYGWGDHLSPRSENKLDKNLVPKDPEKAGALDLLDLSAQNNRTDNLQYAEQTSADKLQALFKALKTTKMVRSQPKHWLTMPMWWQILEMSCESP